MTSHTTNEHYVVSLVTGIAEAQRQMQENLRECLYADRPVYVPTMKEKIGSFFKEAKSRMSNAYDCLVKGLDPYDGY